MLNAQEISESQLSPQGAEVVRTALDLARQDALPIIDLINIVDRLMSAKNKSLAYELYRAWLGATTSSMAYVAYFNFAASLAADGEFAEAEQMNRKALEINPDLFHAYINLGNNLEQQGRPDEALEAWRSALKREKITEAENLPLRLHALNNLGRLLESKRNLAEALEMLEQSLALDQSQQDVILHLVHLRQKQCLWPVYSPPPGVSRQVLQESTSPLAMLAASNDPARQLSSARRFVEFKYDTTSHPPLAKAGYRHDRIRVGYLSSDLLLHAVSMLTVELFELHDRERFEVFAFCWSREDGSAMRGRVKKAMDHLIPIGSLSDEEAAALIRSHEIDILVDLHGLTSGARPNILSRRPAPVQVTYLGFPGPTGIPWIDYVLADRYLIPEEEAPHYTEKPLYLPECFQMSDSRREMGPRPSRSDNNLPEDQFVFCSFNNNYKFTPELFAVWMRILKRVPKSVLWLLGDNQWSRENLAGAAKHHGVETERLIFAPRVAPTEYLARYQLADLFLDTFPFGGGTTANDALWVGLPLLTCSGRTFASRMAGSLLNSLGLPELIVANFKEYEEKAVDLAKNRKWYARLKGRLDERRISASTFDSKKRVKEIEGLFAEALRAREAEMDAACEAVLLAAPEAPAKNPPIAGPEREEKGKKTRLAVYTVLVGDKEGLNDPLCAIADKSATDLEIDFICFTDNVQAESPTWRMAALDFPPLPPEKLSRRPKALPHEYLAEYQYSLYIDNTIAFKRLPNSSDLQSSRSPLFRGFRHPWRSCPLDEADVVVRVGYEDQGTVNAQIDFCSRVKPLGSIDHLTKGTVLLREHHADDIKRFGTLWWEQILTFSRRDQLSLDFALDVSGCAIDYFDAPFLQNDLVMWPVLAGGQRVQASFDPSLYAWRNRSDPAAAQNPKGHFLAKGFGEKEGKEFQKEVPWLEHVCRRNASSLGSFVPPRRGVAGIIEPLLTPLQQADSLLLVRVADPSPLAFGDAELDAALKAFKAYYKFSRAPELKSTSVSAEDLDSEAVYTSAYGIAAYSRVLVFGVPASKGAQVAMKFAPLIAASRGEMLIHLLGSYAPSDLEKVEQSLARLGAVPQLKIFHSHHVDHPGVIPNSVLCLNLAVH